MQYSFNEIRPVFFVIAVIFTMCAMAMLGLRRTDKLPTPASAVRQRVSATILLLLAVASLSLMFIDPRGYKEPYHIGETIEHWSQAPPASIVAATSDGRTCAIVDPAVISEMIYIFNNSDNIERHHSYSVPMMTIRTPDAGITLRLGRDSHKEGEYWVEAIQWPGVAPDAPPLTVRQFKSAAVKDWLRRVNALMETEDSRDADGTRLPSHRPRE